MELKWEYIVEPSLGPEFPILVMNGTRGATCVRERFGEGEFGAVKHLIDWMHAHPSELHPPWYQEFAQAIQGEELRKKGIAGRIEKAGRESAVRRSKPEDWL